ncbi:hypothetical protein CVT26_012938 [Gymnopilus dilepis]|uniref:F-box domain-containing protein n=1 Tax=Gymnopilus dilepis TaxID=231916 RepID=A0A409Y4E0_9AGAR|nr:hypothetical protein CVT26_012938 [Gymnopilus dilepis]
MADPFASIVWESNRDTDVAEAGEDLFNLVFRSAVPPEIRNATKVVSDLEEAMARLETSLILQEKEQHENERQALAQCLETTDSRIRKLKKEYAKINNQSRRCPVLKLPVEITCVIFDLLRGPEYSRTESRKFYEETGRLAEVVVSHVCRYWRFIALGYKSLWTRFKFDAAVAEVVPVERFKAYMARSANRPVDIYLNFNSYWESAHDFESDDLSELVETAMEYAERWRYFLILTEPELPLLCYPGKLEGASAPHLEYFGFISPGRDVEVEHEYTQGLQPTIFQGGAPKLSSVMYDVSVWYRMFPPMQNLTTFCLEAVNSNPGFEPGQLLTLRMLLEILALPSLTNLSLSGMLVQSTEMPLTERVVMPKLENLRISRTEYALGLLPALKAPKLRTLAIAFEDFEMLDDPLQPNSLPALEYLWLVNTSIASVRSGERLAACTNNIKTLVIVDWDFDEILFEFLASSHGLWPNLTNVTMDIPGLGQSLPDVEDFIQTRPHDDLVLAVREHVAKAWGPMPSESEVPPAPSESNVRRCRLQKIPNSAKFTFPAVWDDHWPWIIEPAPEITEEADTEDVRDDEGMDSVVEAGQDLSQIPFDKKGDISADAETANSHSDLEAAVARLDISLILQEKNQHEKEKQALGERLAATDRRIRKLKKDYAKINNQSRRCPVLKLPVEITCIIFALLQGPSYSREESLKFYVKMGRLSEVVVSHVCRYWRFVALGCPILWTRFKFDASIAKVVPVERLKAYMDRSVSRPVDVYLNFNTYYESAHDFEVECLQELLNTAMKYTERWKSFLVMMEDGVPLLRYPGVLEQASAPHLEYFAFISNSLKLHTEHRNPDRLQPTIFRKGAPKLSSVMYDLSLAYGLHPPMQNITTFCLEDVDSLASFGEEIPWDVFLEILSLPCLVNLSLLGMLVRLPEAFGPIVMLKLQNFRFCRTEYAVSLLPVLKAPNLKTLVISSEDLEALGHPFELNSLPALESLWLLHTCASSPWDVAVLAECTSNIRSLIVVDAEFDENFFDFLATSQDCWPGLTTLAMDVNRLQNGVDEISAFLDTRPNDDLRVKVREDVYKQWAPIQTRDEEAAPQRDRMFPLSTTLCGLQMDASVSGQQPTDLYQETRRVGGENSASSTNNMTSIRMRTDMSLILQEKNQREKEREVLQQGLKGTNSRLKELKTEYASINNRSRRCPVLKLPEEITCLVFSLLQDSHPRGESLKFLPEGPLQEIIVSHVCREWRFTALSYCQLWTRFRYDASRTQRIPCDRLEAYLQRSSSMPVELWFCLRGDLTDEDSYDGCSELLDTEDLATLLEIAIKHVDRWKTFFIKICEDAPLLAAFYKLEWAYAPHLEYFGLLSCYETFDHAELDSGFTCTIFKHGAPKLRTVMIDPFVGQSFIPPLQNLTTLCLEWGSNEEMDDEEFSAWGSWIEIVSFLPLVNLSLVGIPVDTTTTGLRDKAPFTLNALENLRVSRTEDWITLLPFVRAPRLKTLVVMHDYIHIEEGTMRSPAWSSLESLYLVGIGMNVSAAQYLSDHTENIKELVIVDEDFNKSFFQFLGSSEGYWSHLRSITIESNIGDHLADVLSFVRTRPSNSIVLKIRDHIAKRWQTSVSQDEPSTYDSLVQICRVERMDDDATILNPVGWQECRQWKMNIPSIYEDEDSSATNSDESWE